MSEYEQIMTRLGDMRVRFDAGFSSSDRELLEELNQQFFGKRITHTGCGDCYRDAYVIIYNKLKREGNMPKVSEYRIRPGEVVHFFGESEYYTLDVSSEVAERCLRKNPADIIKFDRYPEDWEKRISDAKETKKRSARK